MLLLFLLTSIASTTALSGSQWRSQDVGDVEAKNGMAFKRARSASRFFCINQIDKNINYSTNYSTCIYNVITYMPSALI